MAILKNQDVALASRVEIARGLHADLATYAPLSAERRKLFDWQRENDPERAQVLAQLARWQESTDAAEGALATFRAALDAGADVGADVARLTLASGDVVGAMKTVRTLANAAEGPTRRKLRLELASLLAGHEGHEVEALAELRELLAETPEDPSTLGLVAKLARTEACRVEASALLEGALHKTTDVADRTRVLRALLDAAHDAPADTRRGWLEQLIEIGRGGTKDTTLDALLRGLAEQPLTHAWWDEAERLARELDRPNEVADAYRHALASHLAEADLLEVGQRAVAFQEEWFEDPTGTIRILDRLVDAEPDGGWAFDRLKLLYDAQERWDDLFPLYDRVLLRADAARKTELLEDAAQIAKDFAKNADRAIGYMEQLLNLKPTNERLIASLERLYERHGRHRELISLLGARLPALSVDDARAMRVRMASLWLDELGDAASALLVVEDLIANSDDPMTSTRLLERILAAALPTDEVKKTLPPTSSPVTESIAAAARTSIPPPTARPSQPPRASTPPKARGKRVLVRQRAAAFLRERYAEPGKESHLARVLEIELEAVKSAKERIRRHRELSALYTQLGSDLSALEHCVSLVMLEPDTAANRAQLEELAARTGRFDRMAEVLVAAAEDGAEEELRVQLLLQAGLIWADKVGDVSRAIDLLFRVQAYDAPVALVLTGARKLEGLLLQTHRDADRLGVLERVAQLESEGAAKRAAFGDVAKLASQLGEVDRAVAAWEACLGFDPKDKEALSGLVDVLVADKRMKPLVDVLEKRAGAWGDAEKARADRVQIAHIWEHDLASPEQAAAAWARVEEEFGESDEGLSASIALAEKLERYGDLAQLLGRAIARAPDAEARATLQARRGDVLRVRLGDGAHAAEDYRAALVSHPLHAVAMDGLRALLANDSTEASATEILLAATKQAADWPAILELTPHRLRTAKTDAERVQVLLEVAKIAENETHDPARAFDAVREALALSSNDETIEADAVRLAELTGAWRPLADTLRDLEGPLEQGGDSSSLVRLRLRLGAILEGQLDDPRAALAVYQRVLAVDPIDVAAGTAAIRVSVRALRWDAAAKAVLDRAVAMGELDEVLIGPLEQHVQGQGWEAISSAMESAVAEHSDAPPFVLRDLEARVAAWHRDRRADADAAEAAFTRALVHDAQNAELLRALAQLQRRARGRPLIDSLLRLSQATGGDLDLLREAAEVAGGVVVDRALAKTIIERSLKMATERWLGEEQPVSAARPSEVVEHVDWALAELVRIHNEEGDAERIVDLLRSASKLPYPTERKRAMQHEAARVALERLGDSQTALALYAELFDQQPSDALAASQLAELYTSLSRPKDLLALRQRQIEQESDALSRSDLRVLAAQLQVQMGEPEAAIDTLRASLVDTPRHSQSATDLGALLESTGRHTELCDHLTSQASLAEAEGDKPAAVELFAKAANVADEKLANLDRAEASLARSLHLEVRPDTLDSLSKVREKREDWATVAEYLDKLVSDFPHERSKYLLRLADAFIRAHQDDLAQDRLEHALLDPSTPPQAADVLVALYRRTEQWVPLADLLTHQASGADPQKRLALLREASDLYLSRCDKPDAAVPLLEAAGALAPEDRALKLRLAEALRSSGRVDEAKELLRGMLDAFAGRRPKERAVVHFHMARLALAMGQRQQALAELEAATKVDPANPEILRTVAELARDDGQLDKAERSYRALLAVVRRETEVTDETPIVRAEVLVELSALASRQDEGERAQEILESAFEAAAGSDVEARRLEQTLRLRKMSAPLVRALEARLSRAGEGPKAAEVLSELAQILDEQVGDSTRAIDAALRAVREAPALPIVHDRALSLARKLGKESAYLDAVTLEAEKAEKGGSPRLAGELFMRAGAVAGTSDPKRAAELLTRAEKTGGTLAREALRALDKLYGEIGDHGAQEDALARLASIELEATVRDPRSAADVLYRLAAVRLRKPETIDEGAQLLESALGLQPDAARAEDALRAISGEQERQPAVVSLLERVGREPGREATLMRALGLRVRAGQAPVHVVREAAELALRLNMLEEADAMLDACETAAADEPAVARWAALTRSKLAEDRGDVGAALELTLRAADTAPEEEARALRMSVAERAQAAGMTDLWTRALEHALDAHPTDVQAQEALTAAYRHSGRADKLASLLAQRIDAAQDAEARAALRRERAALLATDLARPDEAARELEALLDENAHDAEAGALLLSLLEAAKDMGAMERALTRQLEAAKDREDGALVAKLAQKLGDLLVSQDAAAAREAFTLGLDWEPKNAALLRSLLVATTEPADRADVMERLLEVEAGPAAEKLALDLAATRAESWDDVGAERAFELGLRAHPASAALRDKLIGLYEERNERRKLAALYETVSVAAPREDALALLNRAAVIWRDELNDAAAAARALRVALGLSPDDTRLFADLMSALTLAGDLEGAKVEIGAMLGTLPDDRQEVRGALLAQRASLLAQQGDFDAALVDVDEANRIGNGEFRPLAVELLERAADGADEPARALAYRVKLAAALSDLARDEDARAQLNAVLDADDSHRPALELLAELSERAGDHEGAARAYKRLALLAGADDIVGVVTKLVESAEKAGVPALARGGLEKAHALDPENAAITQKLRAIYEATGAHRELAEMFAADAQAATDDAARFDALVHAGTLYLGKANDGDRALELLTAANRQKPQDMECAVLVVDALIQVGRIDEAAQTTQAAIAAQKGRRSREAGALYHRLARIERHRGSAQGELAMLTAALEMDGQNGIVASELGAVALEANNLELAQKALRVVTMTKSATSMPRAEAYAHLGDIAIRQGDPKRAVMLLKRAISEDANQERAHELLRQLGV